MKDSKSQHCEQQERLSLQQYNKPYFRSVDTRYTKDYAVFMLMDTAYSKHFAVLSGGGYYLYYVLRNIVLGQNSIPLPEVICDPFPNTVIICSACIPVRARRAGVNHES